MAGAEQSGSPGCYVPEKTGTMMNFAQQLLIALALAGSALMANPASGGVVYSGAVPEQTLSIDRTRDQGDRAQQPWARGIDSAADEEDGSLLVVTGSGESCAALDLELPTGPTGRIPSERMPAINIQTIRIAPKQSPPRA
jgi:hypothetical protein